MFQAIILAGGQGTRLKSVTGDLPKPMVDVNGKPFLYRLMQYLEAQGCSKIVLSLCYKADYIIDSVKQDKPVKCVVEYAVEQQPLDTGGAIKLASTYISDEKFLVLNGDTYSDIDYKSMIKFSLDSGLVISGVNVDDVSRYGTLVIDEDSNVLSMNEKGETGRGIINSGTYIISTTEIQKYPDNKFSFERDYIKNYKGNFKAFVTKGYFIDIGIPDDYYKICKQLQ